MAFDLTILSVFVYKRVLEKLGTQNLDRMRMRILLTGRLLLHEVHQLNEYQDHFQCSVYIFIYRYPTISQKRRTFIKIYFLHLQHPNISLSNNTSRK